MLHKKYEEELKKYEALINRKNEVDPDFYNGVYDKYKYPVLTREHIPLTWQYDLNPETNPYFMKRLGINAVMNSGAIELNGKYYLVARIEGTTESPSSVWQRVITELTVSASGIILSCFPIPVPRRPMYMTCVSQNMRTAIFTVCSARRARIPQ